jgi:hypothetical protein
MPVTEPKKELKTVVCRYVGLDSLVESAIRAAVGKDPDVSESGFPSLDGKIYRVRILKFHFDSGEAAEHVMGLLKPLAGVEQFAE